MQDQKTQAEAPAATQIHYESNPFTATWTGVQRLVHTNAQTVIGVVFFNILLFAVMGVTAVAIVLSIAAFVYKHAPGIDGSGIDAGLMGFLNSMSDVSLYATWIIGFLVCIFASALTQSIQLNLTIAAARGVTLTFGALLKKSVTSVLPMLGLISLVLLAILSIVLLVGLLSVVLGIITMVIGLIVILAIIYVGMRLSYATYSIVDLGLKPIAAMKHSWKLSKNHLIETVGSGAVAWMVLAIPSIVVQIFARIAEGTPVISGLFRIIDMVLIIALVIAAAMSFAERYVQLQAASTGQIKPTKLHPSNYLAILLVIVLSPILNALSPKVETGTSAPGLYDSSLPADNSSNNDMYRLN